MSPDLAFRNPASSLEEHLASLLTYRAYSPSSKDVRSIGVGIAEWISGKLLRKRFRRGPLHQDTVADIHAKVSLSVRRDEPIYIIVGFGGYKHFWNPSHPLVDHAELFNLSFMTEYLAPILAVYSPGVILDYESEDIVIPLIDNYPPESLDQYAASFRRLLLEFRVRAALPNNFTIRLMRPQEEEPWRSNGYSTKLFERIDELRSQKEREWEALTPDERMDRLHRTPRSIMWDGSVDLTGLSNQDRLDRMVESKILNETYYEADFDFRGDYFTSGTHIPVVQTWGLSSENVDHWLTLASTSSSTVDFWIGRGILESRDDRYVNRIVSRTQYGILEPQLQKTTAFPWAANIPELFNLSSIETSPANVTAAAVAQGRAPTRT